jgi:hypothetical protein
MPVVVIPLLSVFITGLVMIVVLGRPLKALADGLASWLNGLSGANLVLLGVILGLMMAFDMGGPVNKVAYTFATTGLASATIATGGTSLKVMAAVMAAGMTPPLGLALATTIRHRLFSEAERERRPGRLAARSLLHHRGRHPVRSGRPAAGDPVVHARVRSHRWSGDALREHPARTARWCLGDAPDRQPAAVPARDRHRHGDHRSYCHRSQGRRPRSGQDGARRRREFIAV